MEPIKINFQRYIPSEHVCTNYYAMLFNLDLIKPKLDPKKEELRDLYNLEHFFG